MISLIKKCASHHSSRPLPHCQTRVHRQPHQYSLRSSAARSWLAISSRKPETIWHRTALWSAVTTTPDPGPSSGAPTTKTLDPNQDWSQPLDCCCSSTGKTATKVDRSHSFVQCSSPPDWIAPWYHLWIVSRSRRSSGSTGHYCWYCLPHACFSGLLSHYLSSPPLSGAQDSNPSDNNPSFLTDSANC